MSTVESPPALPVQSGQKGRIIAIVLALVVGAGILGGGAYAYHRFTAVPSSVPTRQHTVEKTGREEKPKADADADQKSGGKADAAADQKSSGAAPSAAGADTSKKAGGTTVHAKASATPAG